MQIVYRGGENGRVGFKDGDVVEVPDGSSFPSDFRRVDTPPPPPPSDPPADNPPAEETPVSEAPAADETPTDGE